MSSENEKDARASEERQREGYVPVGRRGWLKVGGDRRTVEVQPVTPNWSRALREQRAEQSDPAESAKHADPAERAEQADSAKQAEEEPRAEQEKVRGKENE